MQLNLLIFLVLIIGVLSIAIATIKILVRFAEKHPNGKIEVNFKILGCSFGAKASVEDNSDQLEPTSVAPAPNNNIT